MDEMDQTNLLKISVRNLVEFLYRQGDIEEGSMGDSLSAMQAGSRIHRKLQKQGGISYHAEVSLSDVISYGEYGLKLEGRADGIIYDEDDAVSHATIDEIKGMYTDVSKMEEPVKVHLMQALCYAYMASVAMDLEKIEVQMTYVNLDTEEIKRFRLEYSRAEITDWYEGMAAAYKPWADLTYYGQMENRKSIQKLTFPFEYRKGQKGLMAAVYDNIENKNLLFVQAPTGSGKTIATIYPALKSVGEGKADRIFYLTAKTVTRAVAWDTIRLLENGGYAGRTVEITAKDKMCPLDVRACNPRDCEFAKGHFDRINDALYEFLTQGKNYDRESIISFAVDHKVCPYEFCLDLASFSDNILCDYNYVFDPNVCLKRFFAEGKSAEAIFLVDEAHNLVDRGREMFSQNLKKEDFLHLKKVFKEINLRIFNAAEKCNKRLLELKKQTEDLYYPEDISALEFAVLNLVTAMNVFFEGKKPYPEKDFVLQLHFDLRNFLGLLDRYDDHFVTYCDYNEAGEFLLHLRCIDPSLCLQEQLDKGISTTFFSATFLPLSYYRSLLCTRENPSAVYARTIFSPDQKKLLIAEDITSKYTARGNDTYRKYAAYIEKIVSGKIGNYLVFFPSYRFMEEVSGCFCPPKGFDRMTQSSHMTEAEREGFLTEFSEERSRGLIGFCVLGGIFGEGIDLTGERLIGVIVAGLGLPQVNHEQKVISDYFEEENAGFEYAYLYPGMNRVLQAAGRLIRTVSDRGILVLLDQRFLYSRYQSCFPKEYEDYERTDLSRIEGRISDFWENS